MFPDHEEHPAQTEEPTNALCTLQHRGDQAVPPPAQVLPPQRPLKPSLGLTHTATTTYRDVGVDLVHPH